MSLGPVDIFFYIFSIIVLGAALIVSFSQNLLHSVFSLFAVVFGVAGYYLLLGSDFLTVVQILVYAGGVNMLLVFGTMLTLDVRKKDDNNRSFQGALSFIISILLFSVLSMVLVDAKWPIKEVTAFEPTTNAIGKLLLSNYILPFEVISFLLLAAMVGALNYVLKGDK